MRRGKLLSELQKGMILAYTAQGLSHRKIAEKVGCEHKAVANFLKNPQNYGKRRRYGRKRTVSDREKRRILWAASNSTKSSAQIRRDLGLKITSRTIQRVVNDSGYIVRAKMKLAVKFKKNDKPERLRFAHDNMNTDWASVCYVYNGQFVNFRSFSRTKRSGIWMGRMVGTHIGTICARNLCCFRKGTLVVVASWFGVPLAVMGRSDCRLLAPE